MDANKHTETLSYHVEWFASIVLQMFILLRTPLLIPCGVELESGA